MRKFLDTSADKAQRIHYIECLRRNAWEHAK